jgi:serine/threonine protein phosphatase 1
MDTGAGHSGKLTIMDIDKKTFWQSDPLPELYPENFRKG